MKYNEQKKTDEVLYNKKKFKNIKLKMQTQQK